MTKSKNTLLDPYFKDEYNTKLHEAWEQARKSARVTVTYSDHDEGQYLHILCTAVTAAGWGDDYLLKWGNKSITATKPGFKAAPKPKKERKPKAVRNMPRLLVGKNREGI